MDRFFLFQLYRHSRFAFLAVVLFIFFYGIAFFKKMDMMVFPYNDMFSVPAKHSSVAETYAFKINGERVQYTQFPYWKKDFLETAPAKYAIYIKNGNQNQIERWMQERKPEWAAANGPFRHLFPDKQSAADWPVWYCKFAGQNVESNSTIELIQYTIGYQHHFPQPTDSAVVYSSHFP